ncbi:MAG TPA: glutamyl-tRNA reductase [Lacisediminihabitans sp.]|uniref:glutamyl-tRNA reductase n=1 Tax=Lacisediminihabitans sp. TaxID=2787631 RepID=UPI002ED9AC0E
MLLCLTANHHNASFDLLERLSIGAHRAAETLVERGDVVSGAVVLATCNRFEAYLEIDEPLGDTHADAVTTTMRVIGEASGVDPDDLRSSVTVLSGDPVVEHLFAVSSGLESVIVGEDEISGQVRRALERARTAGTTSSGLELLFQKAAHTSRGIKNRTAISGAGRSLVRLGLELASSRVVDWREARVLLVGTGQYAGTTVAALRDRGVDEVTVFSPSGRAEKFATRHGLRATDSLAEALEWATLVITCTSSETPVITAEVLTRGTHRLIIDLGLPRNVDPTVADIEGIELLDLETISLHAPLEELNATSEARALVSEAASEFAALAAEQALTPAVVALRRHVFDLLETEVQRARSRGDDDGRIEAALRHLTGVLLHTPSVRARELARAGRGTEFGDAVSALFGLDIPAATAGTDLRDLPA